MTRIAIVTGSVRPGRQSLDVARWVRSIADQRTDATFEIVDIAVLPEHQKKGLGHLIMQSLMKYIHGNALPTAYVSLMADHGTPRFCERYGFEASLPPKKAGMALRIQ